MEDEKVFGEAVGFIEENFALLNVRDELAKHRSLSQPNRVVQAKKSS